MTRFPKTQRVSRILRWKVWHLLLVLRLCRLHAEILWTITVSAARTHHHWSVLPFLKHLLLWKNNHRCLFHDRRQRTCRTHRHAPLSLKVWVCSEFNPEYLQQNFTHLYSCFSEKEISCDWEMGSKSNTSVRFSWDVFGSNCSLLRGFRCTRIIIRRAVPCVFGALGWC